MTIDEKVRHDLYEGLEKVVGEAPAKLLMTAIPPFSWDNVATKVDISELKGDIAELRSELKGDISELKSDLNADIDLLREDNKGIRGELKDIRNEIRDVRQEIVREIGGCCFSFLPSICQWPRLSLLSWLLLSPTFGLKSRRGASSGIAEGIGCRPWRWPGRPAHHRWSSIQPGDSRMGNN